MDSTPDVPSPPPGPLHRGPLPGTGTEIVGLGGSPKEMFGLPVLAELPAVERPPEKPRPQAREPRRKWRRCVLLFVLTCASMWFAGSGALETLLYKGPSAQQEIIEDLKGPNGPIFMFAMMGILFSHEMGHFLQSLRYRVSASVPYFIPMPISPIGTMGAVIFMGGRNRNRKELFDVGLSGPWAGLLVALPIACYGVMHAEASTMVADWNHRPPGYYPDCLLIQWLIAFLRPELSPYQQLNLTPFTRASWGAMLLTGLNMLPIGQLDGGHVAYALFRKRAHWIARIAMLLAGMYIVISRDYGWSLMYILALLMRPDHPATHDDSQPIGWPRWALGFVSLFIPVICLAPLPR